MRDPWVTAIAVVLDNHYARARSHVWPNRIDHRGGIANEVKAVRGEQPIEWFLPEGDRIAEVHRQRLETGRRKAPGHQLCEPAEVGGIAIDRNDLGAGPEQFGKSEREGAATGPELKPASAGSVDAVPNQRDVIGVFHEASITRLVSADAGRAQRQRPQQRSPTRERERRPSCRSSGSMQRAGRSR
jgi:hypothetical protein